MSEKIENTLVGAIAVLLMAMLLSYMVVWGFGKISSWDNSPNTTKQIESENDIIIREVKKCEEAGLTADIHRSAWHGNFVRVVCEVSNDR